MYFSKFPKIFYDLSITDTQDIKYVTDFFHRVKITAKMIENSSAYDKYIMKDGETVEIISHKLYGTPLYHWTILLVNDITNPYKDLPMNTKIFDEYVVSKYGYEGQYDVHHYEDSFGNIITPITITGIGDNCIYDSVSNQWVPVNLANYNAVSNYDYEYKINDKKRVINVIKPQFISNVVATFEQLMK